MRKSYQTGLMFIAIFILTACSSSTGGGAVSVADNAPTATATQLPALSGAVPGGKLTLAMNEDDRSKVFRALDKAPGKSSQWANPATGMSYIVTPVKKVTVNGNSLCREYSIIAKRGGEQSQSTGTACIGQDGGWHTV